MRRARSAGRSARAAVVLLLVTGAAAAQVVPAACDTQPSTLPAERFNDNGDGTATDKQSQLVWMRCATGQQWRNAQCTGSAARFSWDEARRHVERVNKRGDAFHDEWRLPSLRELASITDRRCATPRTNADVFPGTPSAGFWTTTARPRGDDAGDQVFVLSFGAHGVAAASKVERHHLRLVRTGP
jgi:hypothetical protein